MCCPANPQKAYPWIKYAIVVYNLGFQLFGCLFLFLGIYSEVMRSQFTEADHVFLTPSVFLTTIGVFMLCFSSLGCLGALRDNICFINCFLSVSVLCLVLETGAGISALIFKEPVSMVTIDSDPALHQDAVVGNYFSLMVAVSFLDCFQHWLWWFLPEAVYAEFAKNFVNEYVLKGIVTYYDDQDLKNVFDYIQEDFQCCGGRIFKDWEMNIYHNCSSPGPAACGVPYSCCRPQPGDDNVINSMCGYDTMTLEIFDAVDVIYVAGCIDSVIDFFWSNLNLLAGVLLGIFIPQIAGIILCVMYAGILKNIIAAQNNIASRVCDETNISLTGRQAKPAVDGSLPETQLA